MGSSIIGGSGPRIQQYEQLFTSSDTWTVPTGVKTCEVKMIAGSGLNTVSASAVGAGGYWKGLVEVDGLSSIPVTVGAAATSLGRGGDTRFLNKLVTGSTNSGAQGNYFEIDDSMDPELAQLITLTTPTKPAAISSNWYRRKANNKIFFIPTSSTTAYTTLYYFDLDTATYNSATIPTTYFRTGVYTDVTYVNGTYVINLVADSAVAANRVLYSTNLSSWTMSNTLAVGSSAERYGGIFYANSLYYLGIAATGGGGLYSSTNLSTWTKVTDFETAINTLYSTVDIEIISVYYDTNYSQTVVIITANANYLLTARFDGSAWTVIRTDVSNISSFEPYPRLLRPDNSSVSYIIGAIADSDIGLSSVTLTVTGASTQTVSSINSLTATTADTGWAFDSGTSYYLPLYFESELVGNVFVISPYDVASISAPRDLYVYRVTLSGGTASLSTKVAEKTQYYNSALPSFRLRWGKDNGTSVTVLDASNNAYTAEKARLVSFGHTGGIGGAAGAGGNGLEGGGATTRDYGGPAEEGWGFGGAGSASLVLGDRTDAYGSGGSDGEPGKDGAVLIRWWK